MTRRPLSFLESSSALGETAFKISGIIIVFGSNFLKLVGHSYHSGDLITHLVISLISTGLILRKTHDGFVHTVQFCKIFDNEKRQGPDFLCGQSSLRHSHNVFCPAIFPCLVIRVSTCLLSKFKSILKVQYHSLTTAVILTCC